MRRPDKRDPETAPPRVGPAKSWGIAGSNLTLMQHGFMLMHREGVIWTATEFNPDGERRALCQFSEALGTRSSDGTTCDLVTP